MFKRVYFIFLSLLIANQCFSQIKPFIEYNFTNKQYDTLPIINTNLSITKEKTPFYFGRNSLVDTLEMQLPTTNTYPLSQFTLPKPASSRYNVSAFPIRTAVKINNYLNDSVVGSCSGTMISKKHVLTISNCFIQLFKDSIFLDSIKACPAFDNGGPNPSFPCTKISKAYFPENFDIAFENWGVLELEDTIGMETGWVSIGFNQNDSQLMNGTFYKFSYPVGTFPSDTITYSEDTMYFGFGEINQISRDEIRVLSGRAIPGEGGSSLLKISNFQDYTAYGTSVFAIDIQQARFKNWGYFAMKSIIENDLVTSIEELKNFAGNSNELTVYPNPANEFLLLQLKTPNFQNLEYQLFDSSGKKLLEGVLKNEQENRIQIASLKNGFYILKVKSDAHVFTKKIIKQ